jgi:hypothetical protein
MPYRVKPTEQGDFAVLYYLSWDQNGTAQVFWSQDLAHAEAEAERLNQRAMIVERKLDEAFAEVTNQLKEEPGDILGLFETWLVSKRGYFEEGIH